MIDTAERKNLPVPSKPATPGERTFDGLSPQLVSKLSLGDEEAISAIGSTVALAAEARDAIAVVGARARTPATRDEIAKIIGRRFALYPQPDRSEGEWAAWWADYHQALQGEPPDALEAALAAWIAKPDSAFLPLPGKLKEMARLQPTIGARAVNLMRRGLEAYDEGQRGAVSGEFRLENPVAPKRMPTREERTEVGRLRDEFVAANKSRAADAPLRRPVSLSPPFPTALVDGAGLTAEMRDVLERQYGTRYPVDTRPWPADAPAPQGDEDDDLLGAEEGFAP